MPAETFAVPPLGVAAAVVGDVMLDDSMMLDFRGGTMPGSFGARRATFSASHSGLGGAGNVAANLAGLGVQTALVGMTGDDGVGGRLHAIARVRSNLSQMLFVCSEVQTPRKLRLYNHCTLDTLIDEGGDPFSYYATARAGNGLPPTPFNVCVYLASRGVRVFCEVDHGKGFLLDHDDGFAASTFRRDVRALGVPVIADPRPSANWPYIAGGRVILKMNHEQLNAVVGHPAGMEWVIPGGGCFPEDEKRRHFDAVRAEIVAGRLIHCDYLWLTYGRGGMSIGPLDGAWAVHADAHEVGDAVHFKQDATGCGDTCTAVMANAIAANGYTAAAIVDGFLYANRAAGVAAAHLGCHVLTKKTFEEVQRGVATSQERFRVLAHVG